MKDYTVKLLDAEGFEITSEWSGSMAGAKKVAKYLVSEDFARNIETDRKTLGAHKAEVRFGDECLWDIFV